MRSCWRCGKRTSMLTGALEDLVMQYRKLSTELSPNRTRGAGFEKGLSPSDHGTQSGQPGDRVLPTAPPVAWVVELWLMKHSSTNPLALSILESLSRHMGDLTSLKSLAY